MLGFGGGSREAAVPAEVQEQLLQNPKVQASLRRAGEDALGDPEVQGQILAACREQFPEYAAAATDKVKDWARDPEVQARAKRAAGAALAFAGNAGDEVLKQIEQGPAGVRFLSCLVSLASTANAVLSLLNIKDLFGTHIVLYMVAVYQLLFSLTTVLFEMPPEWIARTEETIRLPVSTYQDTLIENAKFLSLVGGRGLFYIFQGTLWLAFASLSELNDLIVGAALVFVGVIHVLMHFGIAPKDIATKMRHGYVKVRGDDDQA